MLNGEAAAGIAIVEDDRQLAGLFTMMLQAQKIPVSFVAYDGGKAIEKFKELNPRPRIILMDYRLPTMSGMEAMKEILRMAPGTKIIFLSADASIKEEAIKAGAADFIQKPATLKDILDTIKGVAKDRSPPAIGQ